LILFPRVLIKRNSIRKNLEIKEKKVLDQQQKSLIKNPTNSRKMETKINQKKNKIKTSNQDHKSVVKSKKSPSS
jgi:hypothetical protein